MAIDKTHLPYTVPRDIEELKELLKVEEALNGKFNDTYKIMIKLLEHLENEKKKIK